MHGRNKTKRIITRLIRKKTGLKKSSLFPFPVSGISRDAITFYNDFTEPDIPKSYNETYIRAIPRDPEHLYVYWEISPESQEKVIDTVGEEIISSKDTLRLVELTEQCSIKEKHPVGEIPIQEQSSSCLIRVPKPDSSYSVEYGVKVRKEGFLPISVSHPIFLPSQTLSAPPVSTGKDIDTKQLTNRSLHDLSSDTVSSEQLKKLDMSWGDFSSDSKFREVQKEQ